MPGFIKPTPGVELCLNPDTQIARAIPADPDARFHLSWDRFVRLSAVADELKHEPVSRILDAGGFDGALSLFLPEHEVDVIDAITTGGSILNIPAPPASYRSVVAIDVLEHVEPAERASALHELARVSEKYLYLNYPRQDSLEVQKLALKYTQNKLIEEHVEWQLPDSSWVMDVLTKLGFECKLRSHTSPALWLIQYVILNLIPEVGAELDQYLVHSAAKEPHSQALYDLIVCQRDMTSFDLRNQFTG